jgi:putative ABC transport system permease protein
MNLPWLIQMALRDSRGQRLLIALFTGSVLFGIAAIVAIQSLRENLQRIVDEQARTLLGADVILQTRVAPSERFLAFLDRLPGARVDEISFRTMARFPSAEIEKGVALTRFVQVRAIDGPLPFYGSMETKPVLPQVPVNPEAGMPALGKAIVEESLVLQFGLQPGDPVQIGDAVYELEAALIRMAGESQISGFFAPRILVSRAELSQTGLLQTGSVIRYSSRFAAEGSDLEALIEKCTDAQERFLANEGVRLETVADRRRSIEATLDNLLDFLNLIGFIALLLGAIGIAGSVQVFLKSKQETIAILRCMGTPLRSAFGIYLLQILAFGFIGAAVGAVLGIGIQFVLPILLQSFLPFPIEMQLSPTAIGTGLFFGWVIVFTAGLLPLLAIRSINPLQAIRSSVESPYRALKDPWAWLLGLFLLGVLFTFTYLQAREWQLALGFFAALLTVIAILVLLSVLLRALLRRLLARSPAMPYASRVALSNLYRPENRTLLLLVTIGMGTFLLQTLTLTRSSLLGQVEIEDTGGASNAIFIDVQPDQRDPLTHQLDDMGYPALSVLPVVTMRVQSIKGKPVSYWRTLPDSPVEDWVLSWEFRNTYRDHILDNAEIAAGVFTPEYSGDEPFPISLSDNFIEDFGVGIGDSITWNIQGIPVETVVGSIRKVRWQAGRQNFGVVFPLGTIEEAPTVYAVGIRSPDRLQTARIQSAIHGSFPNINLIDLSLVFEALNDILAKAAFVIRFMAGFTLATGLIVLAASLLGSRYQRLRESVLFRTLGAPARFIRNVLALEFLLLGSLAALAGTLLAIGAGFALSVFAFESPFQLAPVALLTGMATILLLTLLTGAATTRGIARHPPLVILRKT